MAGQSQWNDETRKYILDKLSAGLSLRSICEDENMPSESLVRKWAIEETEFGARYIRARELGMDAMADELLAIADDRSKDTKILEDGREVVDQEAINRSRLRVDARKWIMSKIAHKKYGDKITTENTGPNGGPIKYEDVRALDIIESRIAGIAARSSGYNPKPH